VAGDVHGELLHHETDEGGGEVHGWAAEKGRGSTHRGGSVGGGTHTRFHGGEVPSAASSRQVVEGSRRALSVVIQAEEDGAKGVPRDCGGRGGSSPDRRAALRQAVAHDRWLWAGRTPGVGTWDLGVVDRWGPDQCNGRRGQTLFESIQIQAVQFNSNISKF
jgi:hypothetical protein